MSEKKLLKNCPFCGGEAELKEYYETCDGIGDRYAEITCRKCQTTMVLTNDEFYDAQEEFGFTGGYCSQNKAFWNGMHQKLIDKWNTRVPLQKIVERLEEKYKTAQTEYSEAKYQLMEMSEKDSGYISQNYRKDMNEGMCFAFDDAIDIVKEEGM